MFRAGLGPRPVPIGKLSVKRLVHALDTMKDPQVGFAHHCRPVPTWWCRINCMHPSRQALTVCCSLRVRSGVVAKPNSLACRAQCAWPGTKGDRVLNLDAARVCERLAEQQHSEGVSWAPRAVLGIMVESQPLPQVMGGSSACFFHDFKCCASLWRDRPDLPELPVHDCCR